MTLNKILLIGNAGTDPEMRYTPNGNAVTSFRMAVTRRFGGGDGAEPREETEWFTVECWNRQAESVNQYLTKGKKVFVEGRFRSRQYTAQDGSPRHVNEVADARVLFLDRMGAPQAGGESEGAPAGPDSHAGEQRAGAQAGAPVPARRRPPGPQGGERRAGQGGDDVEELPW